MKTLSDPYRVLSKKRQWVGRGVKRQMGKRQNDPSFAEGKRLQNWQKEVIKKVMWSKVIRFFKKDSPSRDDLEVLKGEILEELEGVKRTLRRQTLFLEALKKETLVRVGEKVLQDAEPILQLAESFFYFDSSLREGAGLPSGQGEAAEMVWKRLELLLSTLGLEFIRRTGEPFDPRLHQTVERAAEDNGKMVVTKIIQPGYLYHSQVIRPARVIIGELSTKGKQSL